MLIYPIFAWYTTVYQHKILFFNIHHSQPKLAKKSESNQFKYVIIIIAQAYLITFFTYLFSLFDFYFICTDVNKKHVEEIQWKFYFDRVMSLKKINGKLQVCYRQKTAFFCYFKIYTDFDWL